MFDTAATPGPSRLVERLRADLADVAVVDPVDLPPAQALADTASLLAARADLDALLLRRLADVDSRGLHSLDDSPTTTAWLRGQDAPVDAGMVALARRLSRLPGVEQALRAGSLTTAAAGRIATALSRLRPLVDRPDGLIDGQPGEAVVTAVVVDGVLSVVGEALGGLADDDPRVLDLQAQLSEVSCWPTGQLSRLEAAFVLLAQQVPPTDLARALGVLLDALLPNELERRAARGADDAQLTLTRKSDGSGWLVRGDLDLETGELVHTVLTAAQATDPDNPVDTAAAEELRRLGWEFGDPVPAALDPAGRPCTGPRSRGRRLHDALRLALRGLLDSGALGVRDKVAPHLAVTVPATALEQAPGALPAVGASGSALPLSLVRTWWCDAYVTRFVLGLGHRVVETSHTQRTLKAHERHLKHVEGGGHCQGAGCTRGPGHRLVPHHVDAFAACGTTALRDTVMLCESTHGQLHRGLTVTLKDGRRLRESGWV